MAAVGAFAEKLALDFLLRSATTGIPAAWAVGLSLGVPTSVSGSEIGISSGYSRQTASFGAAASPAGSASNATAMTFGPFSTAASITGIQVWDTVQTNNTGNLLWYGTLTTARTVGVGDSLVIAAGALIITLA